MFSSSETKYTISLFQANTRQMSNRLKMIHKTSLRSTKTSFSKMPSIVFSANTNKKVKNMSNYDVLHHHAQANSTFSG